jgi:hypothetical protein
MKRSKNEGGTEEVKRKETEDARRSGENDMVIKESTEERENKDGKQRRRRKKEGNIKRK